MVAFLDLAPVLVMDDAEGGVLCGVILERLAGVAGGAVLGREVSLPEAESLWEGVGVVTAAEAVVAALGEEGKATASGFGTTCSRSYTGVNDRARAPAACLLSCIPSHFADSPCKLLRPMKALPPPRILRKRSL